MSNNQKIILNLGAGKKIILGAINLDISDGEGINKVCDIRNEIPFDAEHFDEVIADYVLQQIIEPDKFVFVMNEIWRVLKPNGWLKLKVPNATYPTAFKDPLDGRYFTEETFDYFNKNHPRYQYYSHYGFKPWTIMKIEKIAGPNNEKKDRFYVAMRKSLSV